MSLVIALTGTTGVGKTTVADHLVLRHGFQRLRFSDPLKQMMSGMLARQGCPPDYVKRCIEGDLKMVPVPELAGRTPRLAMSTLASSWGWRLHPDLWVTCWRGAVLQALPKGPVVADDCRSGNEYDAVHDLGGLVWRVARDVSGLQGTLEEGLPGFECDANLLNNSSINALLRRIDQLLRDYRRGRARHGDSLPVKWQGERARRRLTADQPGDRQQRQDIGHHDQQGWRQEIDAERRQLELQGGGRAEHEAGDDRADDPPTAEYDRGEREVARA